MSVVLQFRTIRKSTVAINDQWLLLKPELLWLLIVNALQLNELSALPNTFYLEYKYNELPYNEDLDTMNDIFCPSKSKMFEYSGTSINEGSRQV